MLPPRNWFQPLAILCILPPHSFGHIIPVNPSLGAISLMLAYLPLFSATLTTECWGLEILELSWEWGWNLGGECDWGRKSGQGVEIGQRNRWSWGIYSQPDNCFLLLHLYRKCYPLKNYSILSSESLPVIDPKDQVRYGSDSWDVNINCNRSVVFDCIPVACNN